MDETDIVMDNVNRTRRRGAQVCLPECPSRETAIARPQLGFVLITISFDACAWKELVKTSVKGNKSRLLGP